MYRITDFAPRFEQYGRFNKPLMLMRKIEPIKGAPQVKIICSPRGDYGKRNLISILEAITFITPVSVNHPSHE